ncbi:MAG TPA: 3-phosphoshikimate 1-carboxyvinyltransferase [Ktedonobacteraceae bacterium]|nr:3-phosphoshikimate 1-carboxyvinyltransferase [Ktedonobacteraceae bacterium]
MDDACEVATTVHVHPCHTLCGTVFPPSSKYHTLRYMLAAFLARGESVVNYPALSDDTTVLLAACRALGAHIEEQVQPDGRLVLRVQGTGGAFSTPPAGELTVGNAGAVARLLLGICALAPEPITLTTPYPESLGKRPNADLLAALRQLEVHVESTTSTGTLPVTLQRGHARGGPVTISGGKSSQYLSALLFLGPLLAEGLEIEVTDGLTSASFVDLTIQILATAGITINTRERHRRYSIPGGQHYRAGTYTIPGDYPSAAALLGAVAVTGGAIILHNLAEDDEAGAAMLNAFAAMGVEIARHGSSLSARATRPLRGIHLDGNLVIDSVPVIAAAACFARTPSRIYNVANLHLKESDRIQDLANELNKLGCQVTPLADALEIQPVEPGQMQGGVTVEAHADHRLIQALAIASLGSTRPVTIQHAQHIAKSYPHFFADLAHLGAEINTFQEEPAGSAVETTCTT